VPLKKRELLKISAIAASASALPAVASQSRPLSDSRLQSITGGAEPIGVSERLSRISRAQELMTEKGIDAILLEPGSAMLYFTGISWWRSERATAAVIPRKGDIAVVTPFFEEPSVRESMTFGDDVRTWHEHENPFARIAGVLKDRGLSGGTLGLEKTVRQFIAAGLADDAPGLAIVSADPITRGCRMYKSKAELALMRLANEVTLRAYEYVYPRLQAGMEPADVKAMMTQAQTALGGSDVWSMALFGAASAYPHGTNQPQKIAEEQIILMDCGCSVEGYQSDISRTFVFGEPGKQQREVWNTVRRGQDIAFAAARPGVPAGAVDDAVRAYYESLGYGPGYTLPGLSHRTGHGIGMDGHEPVNFVHGETTRLAPGMCFSNEPGLYDPNTFGVRLEDCLYMTAAGPAWFTQPPESLDKPIGRMG
jgi:Xaa-Pro dipeptidase